MISLGLDYKEMCRLAKEKSERVVTRMISKALEEKCIGSAGRGKFAIFGSSWSGILCEKAVKLSVLGQVLFIVENYSPCFELSHIPHKHLNELSNSDVNSIDYLLIAISSNHYFSVVSELSDIVPKEKVVLLYKERKAYEEFVDLTRKLDVSIRISNDGVVKKSIPVDINRVALVLVDIWDNGLERCPYCDVIPGLLIAARESGMPIVHAPTFEWDSDNGRLLKKGSLAPECPFENTKWPPARFVMRQGEFAYLKSSSHDNACEYRKPTSFHKCALPRISQKEKVINSFDELHKFFQDRGILYVLYGGGGTLACLAFKPCGYLNVLKAGYFPILIEDATHQKPRNLEGVYIDMVNPGIVCFQDRGGYTTKSKAVISLLQGEPAA